MISRNGADFPLYGWLVLFALVQAVVVKVHLKTLRIFDLPSRSGSAENTTRFIDFNSTW